MAMTYDIGNPAPGFGHAQKYGCIDMYVIYYLNNIDNIENKI